MFKLNRKSEYALLAVQELARRPPAALASVADLAVAASIPPEVLAKVLQGLKRAGVLEAAKGSGGGYKLARPLEKLRFLDVIRPFEEQLAVVACQEHDTNCDREPQCHLRDPMAVLNGFVMRQIEGLTMDKFLAPGLAPLSSAHVAPARGQAHALISLGSRPGPGAIGQPVQSQAHLSLTGSQKAAADVQS